MRVKDILTEGFERVSRDVILKAMEPLANQKIIWRGMNGGTVYSKVVNDRSGYYGAISDQASGIMKRLQVMHPAFGTYSPVKAAMFGTLRVMVPIQPYKALQSDKLEDIVHDHNLDPDKIVDSYSERMDLENSEIIFDIKEYYVLGIHTAIDHFWDPEGFAEGKLSGKIKEAIKGLRTYQDVIDILTKRPS